MRAPQPSGTNSPSSSSNAHHLPSLYIEASRSFVSSAVQPPGWRGARRRAAHTRAAGERPPRARPWRRGSPGPIPNPEVKPAIAESTAAPGCGRVGRRARGGRFSFARKAPGPARARGPFRVPGAPCARAPAGPRIRRGSGALPRFGGGIRVRKALRGLFSSGVKHDLRGCEIFVMEDLNRGVPTGGGLRCILVTEELCANSRCFAESTANLVP